MVSHLLNLLKKRLKSQGRQTMPIGRQGFTLIELIVSVGIMVMVTTVILANYTTFNKKIKLEGVTQEIVSIIREAQAYGISNKIISGPGSSVAYGVHFDMALPDTVIIFSDSNADNNYTVGEEEEIFKVQSSDRIKQICINQKITSPFACPGAGSVNTADVIYKRSSIYANINDDDAISDTMILFRSAGETANGVKVIVWKSGQVSVEAE
ncbi:MAG: type II secretion system GspH family protein [Parcubacteria group bacterium]|nr:type II secretion system GspH family protein [Parcubacteria group bacterium]MCR4342751.1 type II secretion system GspH family protein [Patescibacteria group bacterium]